MSFRTLQLPLGGFASSGSTGAWLGGFSTGGRLPIAPIVWWRQAWSMDDYQPRALAVELSPLWAELLAPAVPQRLPEVWLAQELLIDLLCPQRRDLIITQWLPWLSWSRDAARPSARPEQRRRVLWLLWALLGLAGSGPRAPVITLLAFDLWVADQPEEARRLLRSALAEQPQYRLANLLEEILTAQLRAPPAR